MRPLFSIDSLMALGIDTREVLPPLRIFFFLGFSTSVYRGVERDRCLRWWWWRWLVPPLLAPPTVPLAAPAVVLVRADSLSPILLHLQKRETRRVYVCRYTALTPRPSTVRLLSTGSSCTRLSALLCSAPHPPLPESLLHSSDLPTCRHLRSVSITQQQKQTYSPPATLSE